MIEVLITHMGSEVVLARIVIENVSEEAGELGDYSVRFAADRCGAVGVHQRGVHNFPRTKYNVLALLRQTLNTLEEWELELRDGTSSSDLARGFRGIGRALQSRSSRLRDH